MADAAAFKEKPFAERLEESTKVRERYADRVPVIITRSSTRGALSTPDLDRSRFLVPQECVAARARTRALPSSPLPTRRARTPRPCSLTLGQLVYVIRRRLHLPPDLGLFLFCNNTLPPTTLLVRELDSLYRADDGFLYIVYSGEAAFGC